MKNKILIIEDETRIRMLLREYFQENGHETYDASNGKEALDIFAKTSVDLVIVDILMPGLNGWEVCKVIRETSNVPIIILTACADEDDKLLGYDIGADDYMTKPFSPKVLVAKAESLLKRSMGLKLNSSIHKAGIISINYDAREVLVKDQQVEFTAKEFDILTYLVSNPSSVITRDMFLNKIWGYDYYGDSRIIDAHIKKIRKKLNEASNYISTVLGVGYKFEVKEP